VKTGASAALEAIAKPTKPQQPAPTDRRAPAPAQQQSPLAPLFGDGLLGRALGGLAAGAIRSLGQQMEAAQRQTQGVYEDAAAAIRASREVADKMGGPCSVGPPLSQSTSSSSVNGRVTKRVVLVLPVTGAGGRVAQAQVVSTEAAGGVSSCEITVSGAALMGGVFGFLSCSRIRLND